MELVLALLLFVALIAAWCILPGTTLMEAGQATDALPVAASQI